MSWAAVKEKIIVKSLKKCGTSNAMDGTEDELLYVDSDVDMDDPESSGGSDSGAESDSSDDQQDEC